MGSNRLWLFGAVFLLLAASCQPAGSNSGAAALVAGASEGQVSVQRGGKGVFAPLKNGDLLQTSDRLQVEAASQVEFRDDRSLVVILPGTEAVIEALSADPAVTRTQIRLEVGSVYAEALTPLAPGMIEVLTAGGSAAIHGSGMIVTQSAAMLTTVGCTAGSASVTAGGTTLALIGGEATTFLSSGVPSPPQTLDEQLFGDNPILMQAIEGIIHPPEIMPATSAPTEPTATRRPANTITSTPKATWTPMVLGDTSTPQATAAGSLRRPTTTLDPALNGGLTPEEQANQGEHTYAVGCQAYGNCVCDSALAVPSVTMTITIDRSSANLAAAEGQLTYPRAAPNLFRITQNDLSAEITFLAEGWELYVEKGGNACSLQTYTRQ